MLESLKIKIHKIVSFKNLKAKKFIFGAIILIVLFLFFVYAGNFEPAAEKPTKSDNQWMYSSTEENFLILDPSLVEEPSTTTKKESGNEANVVAATEAPKLGLWERVKRDMTKMEEKFHYYSRL
ncbi:GL18813 [Drosophila persimilis]|uniref:GL18813 n=1 Tax=Drosophila persimilis TaxID=7234 RepID=B4G8L2_DROPE|nr:GL18813 [Drosophila persimilis]